MNNDMDLFSVLLARGKGGGGGGASTADAVSYDNTTSGLAASNVQDAIDELASDKLDAAPDGSTNLINNSGVVDPSYLPDYLLGAVIYGGVVGSGAVATLTTAAQHKLGTSAATITLTNDTTPITGYEANESIYYIASAAISFAGLDIIVGDWLISTGTGWSKVDNTDIVVDSTLSKTSTNAIQNAAVATEILGQQNTTANGGNGYALINGIRLYAATSAPTGDIPDGSIGIGW